jgi:hypothetical protein
MLASEPLKFFYYRDTVHFDVPGEVRAQFGTPRTIPLLDGADPDGNCPQGRFVSVPTPEQADFIVFPYVLDQFIMSLRVLAVHFFLRRLPHFQRFERKHVFFHCHDRGQPLCTEALLITDDPDRSNTDDPFIDTLPHYPGNHVLAAAPHCDFDKIDLDTNFIGTMSHQVRYDLIQSVMNEDGLNFLIRFPNTTDWGCANTSYLHMDDPAKKRKLERLFLGAMQRSWTTLCPRGMGSSSIRFYETMCLGRIPVHVSDAYRLPFEDTIDYAEFCLFIPEADAGRAGPILRMWLAKRDRAKRIAMCRKARSVWEEYFQPRDVARVCLEHLRRHLPAARAAWPEKYRYAPGELAGSRTPRCLVPENFYANMPADHKKLWINKGIEVEAVELEPGVSLVNGARCDFDIDDLFHLLPLAQELPENGTAVCSGAPSGVVSIIVASSLIKLGNYSTVVYSVENWTFGPTARPGESFKDFRRNVAEARAEDLIRPVRGGDADDAAAFRDACLDLVILAGNHGAPGDPDGFRAWLPKLAPGGRLALICQGRDWLAASALRCAGELGLETRRESPDGLIVLRRPKGPFCPVADVRLEATGNGEFPAQPDFSFTPAMRGPAQETLAASSR